ncbi:DNA-binding transcriptional regulator, LysR family [Pseudooceanicola antarcticus]|uniref:DNA-binding transcriptional regulator, LysR family n=1 Tax=Pseudooceanicola antarcticus TaxID=1247613 RepID=A0A285J8H9_9RHOB|nr:LysR family transcriptional regulator [Pseudooceanicola antarcticus]PJE27015.1 LysR family transcriptional regulator [Pseudooceanicola antarcticus]SNY56157.1 DNA-binding transcriptional regulator, LysR family [Pseudooceanicola antarcticus]
MQLNLLETFRVVLEKGSTLAAATELGITQSAVSRRISQLESELNLELFLRDRGRLVPTRECQALQGQIFGMVDRGQRLQHLARDLRRGNSPALRLRVAVPASMTLSIMPRILSRFLAENDRVQVELHTGPYDTIERMLQDDRAELGFLRIPIQRAGLSILPTISARSVCVMPAGHRLATRDEVKMEDLNGEPLILLGRMRAPRRDLDAAFWTAGQSPSVRIEAHSVMSACSLVAEGLGLTIVNGLMARDFAHLPVVQKPIAPAMTDRFAFAFNAEMPLSQAAENFIACANDFLEDLLAER